jgi:hypothetical protein
MDKKHDERPAASRPPDPIIPVRGSLGAGLDALLSDSEAVDWSYWLNFVALPLHELVALSDVRNPRSVLRRGTSWGGFEEAFRQYSNRLADRWKLADSALGRELKPYSKGKHQGEVEVREFVRWARSLPMPWELPPQLVQLQPAPVDWEAKFGELEDKHAALLDRCSVLDTKAAALAALETKFRELEGKHAAQVARCSDLENQAAARAPWPWGSHETALLRHLAAAAERFWVRYDPSDSTTAPTNEKIADWLKEQGLKSQKMADSIATILRHDELPPGPRSSS